MDKTIAQVGENTFELSVDHKPGMRVPGIIYASRALFEKASEDKAIDQVANSAMLPGVVRAAYAMPDIHWGYGFPIGGVVATDASNGVVSPGGVGFDINCGVRLLTTTMSRTELAPKEGELAHELSRSIPKGLGRHGSIKVGTQEMKKVMLKGAAWAVGAGYGRPEDLEVIEENGAFKGADPEKVSKRAFERGTDQPGTLGAGNHFVEVQYVDEVFDEDAARAFGVQKGQVVAMIHSGSRGVGHQVCTDYVKVLDSAARRYQIELPDRQLACAPIDSPEGQDYLAAMYAAANYAFANRQCLAHWVRRSFETIFSTGEHNLGLDLLYDVGHNLAKFEEHDVAGKRTRLLVHRKGATRAFGPGDPRIPARYREVGQPVIVPGDMGTSSYLLAGVSTSYERSWGSTCHGAGRMLSRHQAKKQVRGDELRRDLESKGIHVVAGNYGLLAEEAPIAYKDVNLVVDVCEKVGLSKRVARLKPMIVLKG